MANNTNAFQRKDAKAQRIYPRAGVNEGGNHTKWDVPQKGAMQHNGIRLQQAGKKIGPIVTPRAAMMTERNRHFNHRLTQMDTDSLAAKKHKTHKVFSLSCPSPIGWERVATGRVRV